MNKILQIFGLLLFVLFQGCYMMDKPGKPQNSKVKVLFRLPTFDEKGEPVIVADSSVIYASDSVFLYQTYVNDSYTIRQMQEDGSSQDSLVYDTMIPYYFLYKQKEARGYGFYNMSNTGLQDKDVDSFLQLRPRIAYVLDTIILHANKTNVINEGSKFSKEYYFKNYSFDKIKLDFDPGFPELPYSISRLQDSLNQAKLTKVVFYINKAFVTKKVDDRFMIMDFEIMAPELNARDSMMISFLKKYARQNPQEAVKPAKAKEVL